MGENKYEIFINSSKVGNCISLKVNDYTLTFREWAVRDDFNGLTRFVPIDKPIYGFFGKDTYVELHLVDESNETHIINNVQMSAKEFRRGVL